MGCHRDDVKTVPGARNDATSLPLSVLENLQNRGDEQIRWRKLVAWVEGLFGDRSTRLVVRDLQAHSARSPQPSAADRSAAAEAIEDVVAARSTVRWR